MTANQILYTFEGKNIEDMTCDELIDVVKHLSVEEERYRKLYFEKVKHQFDSAKIYAGTAAERLGPAHGVTL